MKLNKISLLSAGVLVASLSFYAGTITTPAGAGVSYATTAQLNAQVSKLTNQMNALTQKQSATTQALIKGIAAWGADLKRCSMNAVGCANYSLNDTVTSAFRDAGLTP